MNNRGKEFERKFKQDFLSTFPKAFLIRFPDQLSGYKGTSSNICDFLAFYNKTLYLIETKSHKGNTFPFSAFSQYDKMIQYVGSPDIRVGVVIWMMDHDKVIYLPVKSVEHMKRDNKKSFNIKDLEGDTYKIIPLKSTKKRVFLDTDYSSLLDLEDGD